MGTVPDSKIERNSNLFLRIHGECATLRDRLEDLGGSYAYEADEKECCEVGAADVDDIIGVLDCECDVSGAE